LQRKNRSFGEKRGEKKRENPLATIGRQPVPRTLEVSRRNNWNPEDERPKGGMIQREKKEQRRRKAGSTAKGKKNLQTKKGKHWRKKKGRDVLGTPQPLARGTWGGGEENFSFS